MTEIDHRQTRRDYLRGRLNRADLNSNPIQQLAQWMAEATHPEHPDPTAMILATATASGQPMLRTVLLKHLDEEGICWYSDSRSQKGQQIAENPQASILFYWPELERQTRIDGHVELLPTALADAYFSSRPLGSRMAAAASIQSAVVADRKALEERLEAVRNRYPGGNVPRPESWIGYRLRPHGFEFWQGRENRLHDRMYYQRNEEGWTIQRLMP